MVRIVVDASAHNLLGCWKRNLHQEEFVLTLVEALHVMYMYMYVGCPRALAIAGQVLLWVANVSPASAGERQVGTHHLPVQGPL